MNIINCIDFNASEVEKDGEIVESYVAAQLQSLGIPDIKLIVPDRWNGIASEID